MLLITQRPVGNWSKYAEGAQKTLSESVGLFSLSLRRSNDDAIDGQFYLHKSCFRFETAVTAVFTAKCGDLAVLFSRYRFLALSVL